MSADREAEMATGAPDEGPSPLGFVIAVLRARRLIIVLALALAVPVGVYSLMQHRTYTSRSSFITQGRRSQGGLSGIAAQFGVSVPTAEAGQSPAFYVGLLSTREMLSAAVDTTYAVSTPEGVKRGTLVDLYEVDGPTPAARRVAARELLGGDVQASADQKTGIIHLRVTARYPDLAKAINDRLFQQLSRYNLVSRQSQARAERQFAENRMIEVRVALGAAEERLQSFHQRNRVYGPASGLQLEEQRLQREVQRQQQLYTTLLQLYEQSRLEEVRDTPVFTIIEHSEIPLKADGRGVVRRTALALLLGVLLGLMVALAREAMRRYRIEASGDSATLGALWRETTADLRRIGPRGRSVKESSERSGAA